MANEGISSASLPPAVVGRPPVQEETILLAAEQGFGDTLQFIRYASLVQRPWGKGLGAMPKAAGAFIGKLPGRGPGDHA